MPQPKFSIVIPTVDRPHLLDKTIAACLLSPYPNLEVLVSDNFSAPDTARVVERFRGDPRVRYVRTTGRLSMPDHWEFAWKQSRGDYVIINGDDDAFVPGLIERLAQIAQTLNAGLMSWDAGLYYHPDWDLSGANTFVFMNSHSRLLFDIDPRAIYARYAALEIPLCFPQGTRMCFARRVAERAVSKTGRLFWSPYPDYSAPLLLLGLLRGERYIYWDALCGYGGRSRDSNAAAWDKEQGKAGNPQRAREYFDELHQDDAYPHSVLKIRAYANGHAETLNLLRQLLPDEFGACRVDPVALIAAVECELRGIGIHNPFLGERERRDFEAFLAQQDGAAIAQAMRIVERRQTADRIEAWRANPWQLSWPLVRVLGRPSLYRWLAIKALQRGIARLSRPSAAGKGSSLATRSRDGRTWLDCASLGSHDGLELIHRFDEVVAQCDRRDARNVAEFHDKRFVLAAHDPGILPPSLSPAKAVRQGMV